MLSLFVAAVLLASSGNLADPPSPDALTRARVVLRDIMGDRLDATAPADQKAAARELLDLAAKADEDLPGLWVCLDEARRLAIAAGDKDASLRAVQGFAEQFRYPEPAEPAECLRRARDLWKQGTWPHKLAAYAWYRQAVTVGQLEGLEKLEAEKRVAETEAEAGGRPSRWRDLLATADLSRHVIDGQWSKVSDGIQMKRRKGTSRLVLPANATGEYDAEVVFERTAGDDLVLFFLPVGKSHVAMGWMDRHKWFPCGLWTIGGKGPHESNGTQFKMDVANNQEYAATIKVRRATNGYSVSVVMNGAEVTRWEGPESVLTLQRMWKIPTAGSFGVGGWDSEVCFKAVRCVLRP